MFKSLPKRRLIESSTSVLCINFLFHFEGTVSDCNNGFKLPVSNNISSVNTFFCRRYDTVNGDSDSIGSRLAVNGFLSQITNLNCCCEQIDIGLSVVLVKLQLFCDQNGCVFYKGTDSHAGLTQCRVHAAFNC